jgi:hypothetical protein
MTDEEEETWWELGRFKFSLDDGDLQRENGRHHGHHYFVINVFWLLMIRVTTDDGRFLFLMSDDGHGKAILSLEATLLLII